MGRPEDSAVSASVETDATISHFIPSVELSGSRNEKLRKLDTLIRYLEKLRASLARDLTKDAVRRPSAHVRCGAGSRQAWWWERSSFNCSSPAAAGPYDFFTKS